MGNETPLERVVAALRGRGFDVRRNGSNLSARCPAHEDRHPSLSISEGRDGRALLRCHRGCSVADIAAKLGLKVADLYAATPLHKSFPGRESAMPRESWAIVDDATKAMVSRHTANSHDAIVHKWDYYDAAGEHVGRVVRVDVPGKPKEVRPLRRGPGGRWTCGAMPRPRPLYRLPELGYTAEDREVLVVEGERCADLAIELGYVATTSAGGARAANATDWSPLRRRRVVVLPDTDGPGESYAADVARLTHSAGAESVRVLRLPGLEPDSGDDLVDWVDARLAADVDDDGIPERLAVLLDDAEEMPVPQPDADAAIVATPSRRRAQVLTLDDLRALPPLQWLVSGLVPAASVGFLIGPPNSGKSLLALDWAMRAVSGEPWLDRQVRGGGVVYVLGEGAAGFGARVAAWESQHADHVAHSHFAIVRRLPPLSAADGLHELRAILAEHEHAHGTPALLVVDTLATHWAESENGSEYVGPAMAALAEIASKYRCAVVLIHHERKPQAGAGRDEWAALRGSGAWSGAADFVLQLESRKHGGLRIHTLKQRDAERASPIALRVLGVELDRVDDDGRPVTAPVLVPDATEPDVDEDARRRADHEDRVSRAVRALDELGGTATSKDLIARRMGGKLTLARDAIDDAVQRRLVVIEGTSRQRTYRLNNVPGVCVTAPPYPPRDGDVVPASRP